MSQSRLQNSLSHESEEDHFSENESDDESLQNPNQHQQRRLGRPRGRGKPKINQRVNNRKNVSSSEHEEEQPRQRERANIPKDDNQIEAYVKIVDFLKKIDCDESGFQNKMNPFHGLTASCFWYMVSAEYYSYDFFYRSSPLEAANQVLNRVSKLPLQMPTRFIKTTRTGAILEFETDQVKNQGLSINEQLMQLIPSPLTSNKSENIEKKISLTTVTEDNQFVSSTRALLFNYIKSKIQKSQKWGNNLNPRLQFLKNLQPKQLTRRNPITLEDNKEEIVDASQLDILSRQVKKKKIDKKKEQKSSEPLIGNVPVTQENLQNDSSSHAKSLNQNPQGNVVQDENSMEQEKNEQRKDSNDQIDEEKNEIDQESQTQGQKKYLKQMTSDEVLMSAIINLPLDKVISILESTIPNVQLPAIYPPFMPISKSDPLDFVFQLHEEQEKYLEYMKEYKKKVYQSKVKKGQINFDDEERETQFEDAKCQICTDGDYTDDNLIVFCSTCNISLHQRCVGLAKVPAQSWVCDVCLAFGPAGINLPCPLCNIKGGAMKRTNIHIDSNLWKQTNPGYYEFSKKCPYNKQKQEYVTTPMIASENPNQEEKEDKEGKEGKEGKENQENQEDKQEKEELYYDYFNKTTYPSDQPNCHYVWVHYVCSIWVPECYFEEKNGVINVRGIENIEKKRYKHECFVCKKSKTGACVKCEDQECRKYYHPECARKKKVYMQQLNLEKIKYLIFCQEHEPLKITRQIEYKKKKNRDQIIKFARMIEKYIETYKIAVFPFKLMKIIPTKSFIQTFEHQEKEEEEENKPEVIQQTDEDFIKEIIIKLSKVKKISVTVVKTETGLKILEVNQPSRREMRKCLNKYDDFWHTIQNGENAQENCKRYDRIMKENVFLKDKMQTFLNGGSLAGSAKQLKAVQKSKKKARCKNVKQQVETLIEEEGGIFCICRKPYENEMDMLECEICGQWYHYNCIGFTSTEADAQKLEFHCMKCMKFQSEQEKRPRLEKCIHMFATDSLYLNYSPPTPILSSIDDPAQIRQELDLEEKAKQIPDQQSEKDLKGIKQTNDKVPSLEDVKISDYPQPKVVIRSEKLIKIDKQEITLSKLNGELKHTETQNLIAVSQTSKDQGKLQSTITQFLNKSKKTQSKQAQSNQMSVKDRLAELQRSVRDKQYKTTKK